MSRLEGSFKNMKQIKHQGINKARTAREPLEAAFAKKWEEKAPTTLGYILCGQDTWKHNYSERDAEVAATIIQWLGSSVGSCFIDEVREYAAEYAAKNL